MILSDHMSARILISFDNAYLCVFAWEKSHAARCFVYIYLQIRWSIAKISSELPAFSLMFE